MPFTQKQIAKFEAIRKNTANLDELHRDKRQSFKEKFEIYKDQMNKSNVILSYPHWVMSERLRIQDPDLYNTWHNEMQATGIETPVPKSTKIAQQAEAIKHVLKRARENQDVDLDASPPHKKSLMIDDILGPTTSIEPVQSTSPEPVSPIRSDELEDMLNTLPKGHHTHRR
ncbi:unnamed protein product [Dicrocoelium dendriticum]|nr:unnamed protein product [Dicrocoelium dendriticum]